jgi:hypothetical protein
MKEWACNTKEAREWLLNEGTNESEGWGLRKVTTTTFINRKS